jgi:uncharacterized protein
MLISDELLGMLRCPEDRTMLTRANQDLVDRLNQGIVAGQIKNRIGQTVGQAVEGGLIREDRKYLYPVLHGIPIMLVDDAIPLDQLSR